jgi:hypothetical protein
MESSTTGCSLLLYWNYSWKARFTDTECYEAAHNIVNNLLSDCIIDFLRAAWIHSVSILQTEQEEFILTQYFCAYCFHRIFLPEIEVYIGSRETLKDV